MKNILLASIVIIGFSGTASARMLDIVGGADNNTQTVHHCGFLPMSSNNYTNSPAVTRVVERKLVALGYLAGGVNGTYESRDKEAIKRFQDDHGLKITGMVDAATAQRLAYNASKSPNIHKCFGLASAR